MTVKRTIDLFIDSKFPLESLHLALQGTQLAPYEQTVRRLLPKLSKQRAEYWEQCRVIRERFDNGPHRCE